MIIVIGSVNLDLITRVNALPLPGQTIVGNSFASSPGGKGANQALAARRAGADVKFIGAVGADSNADAALGLLKAAAVDLSALRTIEVDCKTGVALILVDEKKGENQIVVVAGANLYLSADDVRNQTIEADNFVVLQMEIPMSVNLAAIEMAKKSSAFSIINIAPYSADALELARRADITIANETEFDALAEALELEGLDREQKAQAFYASIGKTIIITLGPDGALAVANGKVHRAISPTISAIDTVGAGDTFCGAFAVGLGEKMCFEKALEFACAAGALACLKPGAQPSIPLRADIDAILA